MNRAVSVGKAIGIGLGFLASILTNGCTTEKGGDFALDLLQASASGAIEGGNRGFAENAASRGEPTARFAYDNQQSQQDLANIFDHIRNSEPEARNAETTARQPKIRTSTNMGPSSSQPTATRSQIFRDLFINGFMERNHLTEEQRPKVIEVLEEQRKRHGEVHTIFGNNPQASMAEHRRIDEEARAKFKEIMTPEQYSLYAKASEPAGHNAPAIAFSNWGTLNTAGTQPKATLDNAQRAEVLKRLEERRQKELSESGALESK